MDLECKIDHLLADLDANKHIGVVEYLWEELSSAHANLHKGYFLVVFFNLSDNILEEFYFILEKLTHNGVFGLLRVDWVPPDEWWDLLPHWVTVVLLLGTSYLLVGGLFVFLLNFKLHGDCDYDGWRSKISWISKN